jgi:hypothetical protein
LSLLAIGVASRSERGHRVHLPFNTPLAARDTGPVTQRWNRGPDPADRAEPPDPGAGSDDLRTARDEPPPASVNPAQPADSGRAQGQPEPSVFDEPAAEDRDIGWGDHDREDGRSDEWYRRERPPHHG